VQVQWRRLCPANAGESRPSPQVSGRERRASWSERALAGRGGGAHGKLKKRPEACKAKRRGCRTAAVQSGRLSCADAMRKIVTVFVKPRYPRPRAPASYLHPSAGGPMRRSVLVRLAAASLAAVPLPLFVAGQAPSSAGAADVHLQLANLLFSEGRFAEARDSYRRAVTADDRQTSGEAGAGLV